MARDGVFFRRLAAVHPRYRTPAAAIVAQSIWTSVLVLSAETTQLVNYTGFSITLFLALAVGAVFVLRAREPNAERPFRALGYPVAPAIYVIASAFILVNALWTDPVPIGAGALIIALGIPLYYVFRRRQGPPSHS
jgi:APA family basic amino acid/polyamine antiporter